MPYATSVAAATLVFAQLFGRDAGLINWLLGLVGIDPVDWRNGNWAAQIAISTIVIWRWTGYNALIYLAAMQAIPPRPVRGGRARRRQPLAAVPPRDAARRCGRRSCSRSSSRRSAPSSSSASRCSSAAARPSGGAEHQYQTLGLFLYEQGWQIGQLGRAAAVAWVMFVLILGAGAASTPALARRRERAA